MSYWNPSQEEAESQYDYSRRQYYNASAEKRRLQYQKDACMDQRQRISNSMQALKSEKLNFEKRLKGIEKIIEKLEGRSGLFSGWNNVPSVIAQADKRMKVFEESYERSIKVSDVPRADLRRAFGIQTVEGNTSSANALQIYRQKYQELAESIERIQRSIEAMDAQMDELVRQTRLLTDMQQDMTRLMNNSLYNMEHYRQYL